MTHKIILIFFGLYLTVFTARSQSFEIKGIVVDSLLKNNIEYANILLLNNDSSFNAGTTSDSIGHFYLKVKENKSYLLKISCLSYKSKICLAQTNQFIKIELTQDEVALNEVVVKENFDLIKNSASSLIFRVTESMRENAFLTTQILEKIPSVYVDFNNKVYVNGNGKVLILQNGIELPSNSLLNQILPQSVERVEIRRIIPTKYLNRGISSVINIITKRVNNINLKLHGNLSFNKLYDGDINFNIDKDKHKFYTYYKLYYRNFLDKKMINDNINAVNSTYYLQTMPRKEFDNEFFYGYSNNLNSKITVGIDGYLSLYNEYFLTQRNSAGNFEDYSNSKTKFTTQNYSSFVQFNDSVNTLNIRINYNNKKVNNEILYYKNTNNNSINNNNSFSSEMDYTRQINGTFKLDIGANYNNLRNQTQFNYGNQMSNYSFSKSEFSGYLDLTKDFKKFSILLGVNMVRFNRYFIKDQLNVSSIYMLPEVSGVYNINQHNSLMLNFYSEQHSPSIWELMATPINITPNYTVTGNPYLKPENTRNLSFEYDYSKGTTYFSSKIFYKITKNKIVNNYININANHVISSKENLDDCNDIGFSTSYNNKIFNWWTIRMNLDLYNKDIPENDYCKKNLISFNTSMTNAFFYNKKWTLAIRYEYNGRRLVYNGYLKPYNNSIMQLRCNVNKKVSLSLIWIQPIDAYKSKTMIYYNSSNSYTNQIDQIEIQSILFSFTYNIINNQKKNNAKMYTNEDKKY